MVEPFSLESFRRCWKKTSMKDQYAKKSFDATVRQRSVLSRDIQISAPFRCEQDAAFSHFIIIENRRSWLMLLYTYIISSLI